MSFLDSWFSVSQAKQEERTDLLLAGLHQGIGNEAAAVRYEAFALGIRNIPTPVEAQVVAATRLTLRAQRAQMQTAAAPAPAEAQDVYDPNLVKREPEPETTYGEPIPEEMVAVKQEPGVVAEPRRSSRLGSKLAKAQGKVATAFDMAEFERQYLLDQPVIDVDQIIREELAEPAPDDDDVDEVMLFDDEPEQEPEVVQVRRSEREKKVVVKLEQEEFDEEEKVKEEEPEGEDVNEELEGESAEEKETPEDIAFIADDEPEVYVEGVDIEEELEEELEESEEKPKKAFVIESSSESDTEGKGSKPHRKR